ELLVSPAPSLTHQRALGLLYHLLLPYAESVGLELLFAPFGILFSSRTEVQPDIVGFRLQDGSVPDFSEPGRLVLAVESLSPSSMRADYYKMRTRCQRFRVHESCSVDAAIRLIPRWRPDDEEPEALTDAMSWQPVVGFEPLAIDVAAYFRD